MKKFLVTIVLYILGCILYSLTFKKSFSEINWLALIFYGCIYSLGYVTYAHKTKNKSKK